MDFNSGVKNEAFSRASYRRLSPAHRRNHIARSWTGAPEALEYLLAPRLAGTDSAAFRLRRPRRQR
jgi:hypothetical protein